MRRQLLDVTARICSESGTGHLTLDAVAREAGVSKGGLLHHFPSKQALLEGLCDDMLDSLDRRIDGLMANDPDPSGRFSRAYLEAASAHEEGEDAERAGVLFLALFGEAGLRARWREWLESRLLRHEESDSGLSAWIVRLAADGLWLDELVDGPRPLRERRDQLMAELVAMTRRN